MTIWLTAKSGEGCIVRDSMRIEVLAEELLYDTVQICEGDTFAYQGLQIFNSGNYLFDLPNDVGCDSILYLEVEFRTDTVINDFDFFICPGDSLLYGNFWIADTGQYVFTQDEFSCVEVDMVKVNYYSPPDYGIQVFNVLCFGESNGEIEIVDLDDHFDYAVLDSSGRSKLDISNLSSGVYMLSLVDTINGCIYSDTITVDQPDQLELSLPPDTVIEFGSSIDIGS